MKVTVSVPGKINIMGDHAIVHGKPSILTAVNFRLTCVIDNGDIDGLVIKVDESPEYIRYAIEKVQNHYQLKNLPPMVVNITSDIPIGYHLGSSAATAVATVGAAMYFLKNVWNPQLINQLAYEVEKKQHGNPSGGDNTAVTFGGLLWYRKELEFLKSMWQLPFKIPDELNHFFLIDTGRSKESTREMVVYVQKQIDKNKLKMEKILNENEIQTKRIAKAIKENDEKELVDALTIGERTLEAMGVVSNQVMPIIRKIEAAGGAAKILGGGGRAHGVGFLLAYHHEPEVLAKKYKLKIKKIKLGEEGVRLESK